VFSRRERLPRALFPATLSTGRRLSSPHFSAVVSEDTKGIAVVVPKKVARLSVTRHRIKRRTLAALRTLRLPPALILFPKESVQTLGDFDMKLELAALLSKIRR
jgi:ribonuclease P protein component